MLKILNTVVLHPYVELKDLKPQGNHFAAGMVTPSGLR